MNQFRRSKVCSQTFLLAKTKRWFRQWVIGAMSLWGGAMLLVAPHSRADELVLPGAGNEVWRTSHGALEVRENILHNAQSIGSDPAETFLAVRNEENYTALLNQTSYSFEYHLPWGLVRLIEHELEGKSLIQEQVEGRVALPAVPSSTSYTYFSAVQESISRSLDQDPMITRMHQRARALCRLARPTIDPSMTYSHPLLTEPYFDPQSDLLWITDQKEPLAVTSLMRNPGQIL